jgi:serpin B
MRRISLLLVTVLLLSAGGAGVMAQSSASPQLVAGNTAFGFELYGALASQDDGNLFVSPYSVSQALAMTYAGAGGNTAEQMAETMQFLLEQDAIPPAFQALNDDLIARGTADADPDNGYPPRSLQIANGLWGEQTVPFDPAFGDELAVSYGAGLQPVDFMNDPEGAREEINRWVADHTEQRIEDIVPEGAITPTTLLVLANAIYFYGGWLHTFSEDRTADDTFTLADGAQVTAPFMFQQEFFRYGAGDGYQIVELPYAGSGFVFTVILPDDGAFGTIEGNLAPAFLEAALASTTSRELILHLPKFAFTSSASLGDTLQSMGMTDAFDPALADFSGMLAADARTQIFISDVLHKAFIAVDERGTEAAAATVVMLAGAAAPAEEPLEVRIDRPFVFLIRDSQTGTVLFIGRVMDPTA